jgi:hypothetical protein
MRSVAAVTIAALISGSFLAGCGGKYKPKEAVIGSWQRTMEYPPFVRSQSLQYLGSAPRTAAPLVPFMAFGAAWDLDLVAMTKSDQVDMVELGRITTPYGPMWVAIESDPRNGEQSLVTKAPGDIDTWMPELPLARKNDPSFKVVDQSGPTQIDVSGSYEAIDGRIVDFAFLGDPPEKPNKKRNGNTFEHSQSSLLAVLDISTDSSLFKANVKFDGKGQSLKKVAGVVPGQFALIQSQGGLAVGSYVVAATDAVDWSDDFGMVEVLDPNAAPPPPPPEAVIQTAIATSIPALQACYTTALAETPELAGRFVVKFAITDGELNYAQRKDLGETEGALINEAFEGCVASVFGGYSLPKASGAGTQELTFTLPTEEGGEPAMSFGEFRFVERVLMEERPDATEPLDVEEEAPADGEEAPAEEAPKEEAPAEESPEDDAPTPEEGGAEPADGGQDDGLEDLLGDDDDLPGLGMAEPAPVDPPLSHFTTTHAMRSGKLVKLPWEVSKSGNVVTATQTTDMRTLSYNYMVYGEALELASITVQQYGRPVPVTAVHFSPALPDLRLQFNGRQTHRYVIDVGGQENHATGTVEVFWEEGGPKVRVLPDEPEWTASRALVSSILYGADGSVSVTTQRVNVSE